MNGKLELLLEARIFGHAVDLGEGDGRDAVAVHVGAGAIAATGAGADVAIGPDAIEQVLHAAVDLLAVFAFVGGVAGGEESHEGVGGHGDGMLAATGIPGAVGGLLGGEIFQGGFDDGFGGVIDDDVVLHDDGGLFGRRRHGGARSREQTDAKREKQTD